MFLAIVGRVHLNTKSLIVLQQILELEYSSWPQDLIQHLIEGVAEAADGFYAENSIHHLASLAYRNDYKVNLNTLFKSFSFFGSVSSLSYIYSGSFIEFLETEYGIEKVKEFYRTNDFHKSFEADLTDVVKNYEMFLDTSSAVVTKHQANYYFGRKSLISKVCPRYISSSLTKAWQYYSEKNYETAGEIFEDILSRAENYSAIVGLSKIYEDTDSLAKAIHLLYSSLEIFNGTSTEYDLRFRLAELYVKIQSLKKRKNIIIIYPMPSRVEGLSCLQIQELHCYKKAVLRIT
jgi:tetratricopeptide (TPR) repeat protein